MTEVPLDYLKAHVPEEYARRMALVSKGINSAKANNARKVRMIERLAKRKKRADLQEKFDI